jgi:hypothetical protein
MAESKKLDEKKAIGVSYVMGFYVEVEQITSLLAQYVNFMLQLEQRYSKAIDKIDDSERELLDQLLQTIRLYIIKTQIKANVIHRGITKNKVNHTLIDSLANSIKNSYIIDRKELEKYIFELNLFVTQDIITDIITNNQEIVSQIYGQQQNEQIQ